MVEVRLGRGPGMRQIRGSQPKSQHDTEESIWTEAWQIRLHDLQLPCAASILIFVTYSTLCSIYIYYLTHITLCSIYAVEPWTAHCTDLSVYLLHRPATRTLFRSHSFSFKDDAFAPSARCKTTQVGSTRPDAAGPAATTAAACGKITNLAL